MPSRNSAQTARASDRRKTNWDADKENENKETTPVFSPPHRRLAMQAMRSPLNRTEIQERDNDSTNEVSFHPLLYLDLEMLQSATPAQIEPLCKLIQHYSLKQYPIAVAVDKEQKGTITAKIRHLLPEVDHSLTFVNKVSGTAKNYQNAMRQQLIQLTRDNMSNTNKLIHGILLLSDNQTIIEQYFLHPRIDHSIRVETEIPVSLLPLGDDCDKTLKLVNSLIDLPTKMNELFVNEQNNEDNRLEPLSIAIIQARQIQYEKEESKNISRKGSRSPTKGLIIADPAGKKDQNKVELETEDAAKRHKCAIS